ncbi:hypothetical protein LDENG_00182940 [Lucifuga dentata]|nr:hypothetical protein LDENG_00182940 [Lucifuga dentata]
MRWSERGGRGGVSGEHACSRDLLFKVESLRATQIFPHGLRARQDARTGRAREKRTRILFHNLFTSPDFSIMGVKMLQCFPFYRRCKERCKGRQCPPASVPIEEMKPRLSSTTSWGSDSEGAGSLSRGSQIYFSTKARLSFRHQLDSNINAVDATY